MLSDSFYSLLLLMIMIIIIFLYIKKNYIMLLVFSSLSFVGISISADYFWNHDFFLFSFLLLFQNQSERDKIKRNIYKRVAFCVCSSLTINKNGKEENVKKNSIETHISTAQYHKENGGLFFLFEESKKKPEISSELIEKKEA